MAATRRAIVETSKSVEQGRLADQEVRSPWAQIARLARLHDEAAETAHLANLLGRMPYLAAGLSVATCIAAGLAHVELAPLVTWLVLMGAGVIALTRSYLTSIAAPFERAALRDFARDLQAILLYVGFAWGAGSFLAVADTIAVVPLLLFSIGASVLVAIVVRESEMAIAFAAPTVILCALAAAVRPFANSLTATAAVLVSGLVLVGLVWSLGRLFERKPIDASLPPLPAE